MIPIRLSILKALTKLLEETTGPDHEGNPFVLTGQVFRGRTEYGDETSLPAISILEAPTPDIGRYAGDKTSMADTWTLLLQGWAKDDKINPSDPAYFLAAAMQAQLAKVVSMDNAGRPVDKINYMLGGRATSFEIGPSVVRPVDARASSRAFCYMPIRVGVAQELAQPYRSD